MDLPDGCTTRAATFDDVADVCALGIAVDVAEYGEPDYEEADVREDWSRERVDLARDSWLVHDASGRLVGYAGTCDKEPHALVDAAVFGHPDGPDLYPWLVDAVSRRSQEHAGVSGSTRAHVFNSEPNTLRAKALRAAGYDVVRVFRRMVIDLDVPPPAPDAAPGVVVRPVAPDDLPACYAINRDSFRGHFDHVPETYERWHARLVESETYRPEYWWLAEVDGVAAAILLGQRHEEDGWVRSVGTLASARGRGAATALLLTAFAAFRRDGAPRVGLGVDSDNATGAMALYERLGMRAERRYDCYERVFTSS